MLHLAGRSDLSSTAKTMSDVDQQYARFKERLSSDTITSPIVNLPEIANAAAVMTHMFEASPSSIVLGKKSTSPDSILEAFIRLNARDVPIIIKRSVIPSNEATVEGFRLKDCFYDIEYLTACEEHRRDVSVLANPISPDELLTMAGSWQTPLSIDETVIADDDEED